jgi:hypothetical protein
VQVSTEPEQTLANPEQAPLTLRLEAILPAIAIRHARLLPGSMIATPLLIQSPALQCVQTVQMALVREAVPGTGDEGYGAVG